jgi:TolA-binding protein
MRIPIAVALAIALPAALPAQKKNEMVELQRELALLQEEVRSNNKAQNDRLAAIDASLKAILDQLATASRSITVLDGSMKDRMERSVVQPVTAVGAKVDGLAEDFRSVREMVNELNVKMGKLQQQVVDLNNVIRTMQAPPAPPPADSTPAKPVSGPPPGVSAKSLYDDALRDKSAGNSDLALKEFGDYLTWFGDSELAPNAQYQVGEILYNQKKYDEASRAFDKVLEGYPKNSKTLDAHFMKGRSLVRLGQRNEGADEFREIIRIAPSSDLAGRARAELRDLGLSPSTAAPPKTRKK